MKKVIIGLSGGVDSSVAAWLLKEQGYEVEGLFMVNWHDTTGVLAGDCPAEHDRLLAQLVAKKLQIPFHEIDLSEDYRKKVVEYMFNEYEKGRTPNPDVLCNREIKFGPFLEIAKQRGADYVATGHYCRRETIEKDGKTYHRLLAGADKNKDQSYFLCQLSQEQLADVLFPIGHLEKPEVRRIAHELGLATADRKDSQGICFVGKVDLPVFLQQKLQSKSGDIIEIPADASASRHCKRSEAIQSIKTVKPQDRKTVRDWVWRHCEERSNPELQVTSYKLLSQHKPSLVSPKGEKSENTELHRESLVSHIPQSHISYLTNYHPSDGKVIGTHNGAHFYTIGQRKGLNVGGKAEPLFVIGTDVEKNIVYVGMGQNHPGLYRNGLFIRHDDVHWLRPDLKMKTGESRKYSVRIRYRQPLQSAQLFQTEDGIHILFEQPQRGITPGQFAAWYDGEELIGSGVIFS